MELQLHKQIEKFDFFSVALDDSCDVRDRAQLPVFLQEITKDFQNMESLVAMQSIKGTTTGSDFFTEVGECFGKVRCKWHRLVGVTTDECSSLIGKNVGLLKRILDQVTARNQK